jgi:hypothetical protein
MVNYQIIFICTKLMKIVLSYVDKVLFSRYKFFMICYIIDILPLFFDIVI